MSGIWIPDITTANAMVDAWQAIAMDVSRHCKWKAAGQCLMECRGLAVCRVNGLIFVSELEVANGLRL